MIFIHQCIPESYALRRGEIDWLEHRTVIRGKRDQQAAIRYFASINFRIVHMEKIQYRPDSYFGSAVAINLPFRRSNQATAAIRVTRRLGR